ncbi:MAG: hypothetical protein KDD41_10730 [Flavobacteriales bacterium]|nr:hypothetical protein [Flavobacteriales bacterium]
MKKTIINTTLLGAALLLSIGGFAQTNAKANKMVKKEGNTSTTTVVNKLEAPQMLEKTTTATKVDRSVQPTQESHTKQKLIKENAPKAATKNEAIAPRKENDKH